jgi:hypothetical protein
MPVNFLQKQEARHGPRSSGRAKDSKILGISMSIENQRRTAGNSEKQRVIPLLFQRAALHNPRISAENEATLAVNFWEEQRKQRGRASRQLMPKQCSGPRKRCARTSAAYSAAAAAISGGQSIGLRFHRTGADINPDRGQRFYRAGAVYARSAANPPLTRSRCGLDTGRRGRPALDEVFRAIHAVIASEAKQSRPVERTSDRDCFVAFGFSQ